MGKFVKSDVCTIVEGYVEDTMKQLNGPIICSFLDLDLVESTKSAVKHVWPLMVEGSMLFTHEALDIDCCRIFFDDEWWKQNLGCQSPGYVGSGCGLPLGRGGSPLGYAIKMSSPESVGFEPYSGLEKWRRDQS